jgi:hypothetical protein
MEGAVFRILRRIGIAIGSLTIAYLAFALIAGIIGQSPVTSLVGVVLVVVVGALIYQDIIGRETHAS